MFENYADQERFYALDKYDIWLGYFEKITSVQWLERFTEPGECKLTMDLTDFNVNLYNQTYSIVNADSPSRMVICHNDGDQEEGSNTGALIVRGFSWMGFLDRRIVRGTHIISNVEKGILGMSAPGYDVMTIGSIQGFPATTSKQISWGTCMDAIRELEALSGYGVACDHNFPNNTPGGLISEYFYVVVPEDRSIPGSTKYLGVFSDIDGTLTGVQVAQGWENYRNIAVVAGEDQGSSRKNIEVYIGASKPRARDRLEMYVDARDIQSNYVDDSGVTHTLTDTEYKELLRQRGLEKLQENIATLEVTAIPNSQSWEYRKDFKLGDTIALKLRALSNANSTARIEEVINIYEPEAITVQITLSNFELNTVKDG